MSARAESYRIVAQSKSPIYRQRADSPSELVKLNQRDTFLDDQTYINKNQARINEICLECRSLEEDWLLKKRKFKRVEFASLILSIVLAAASLSLSTWLLFFDAKFNFLKVLIRTFSSLNGDLIVLLPIVYFFTETVWFVLELVQLVFSAQISKVLSVHERRPKRAPKRSGSTKTDGELPEIRDDYVAVCAQPCKITETIYKLNKRISLKHKFKSLQKWFVIYCIFINLIFVLFIFATKLIVSIYLIRINLDNDLNNSEHLNNRMIRFLRHNSNLTSNFFVEQITNQTTMAGDRQEIISISSYINQSLTSQAGFDFVFTNVNKIYECCYYKSAGVNYVTAALEGSCDASDETRNECFQSIGSNLRFTIILLVVIFILTALAKFIIQLILIVNLNYQLFKNVITKSLATEIELLNEYNKRKGNIFEKNVLKQIEQSEEMMANEFYTLPKRAASNKPRVNAFQIANNKNKEKENKIAESKPTSNHQAADVDDDDDDDFGSDSYDELPQDVRMTLKELNKSIESFEKELNRTDSRSKYQNLD